MRSKPYNRFNTERFRRSVYLLPNLCTAMNMFCGFYAIVSAINDRFVPAAYALIIAGVFDNLDGKIARVTRSTSKFGVEFDSLADLVSFGVAPGLMIYLWALEPLHRLGWLAAFLFVVCGALRLARFNTQVGRVGSEYFVGLPIPAAAGMNAVVILFCEKLDLVANPLVVLVMLYLLSFLMVSTIRYPSFKKAGIIRNKNFNALVGAILILIFIAAQPSIALFLIGMTYVASGFFMTWRLHKLARHQEDESPEENDQRSSPV